MKKKTLHFSIFILFLSLVLAACAPKTEALATATHAPTLESTPSHAPAPLLATLASDDAPIPFPTNIRVDDDTEYRIPVMLGFDAIYPVYAPIFVFADEAPLQADELVMGLAINGQAKAYPVTVLRFREMVNDEIAGWPVLVSW